MAIAHTMGITSVGRALLNVGWGRCRRGWIDVWVLGGTVGSIAIYWFKSKTNTHAYSKYWHVLFHLTGQTTWVTHILHSHI